MSEARNEMLCAVDCTSGCHPAVCKHHPVLLPRPLPVPTPAEPGLLREALEQARDGFEMIFGTVHPGDMTDDEMHAIAQAAYFGMEHIDAALSESGKGETE